MGREGSMGIGQRLNRKLEEVVGNSFARVFGGNVVPQEVAQSLQREGEENVRELAGGRVLAPNHYIVQLGPADHQNFAGDEERITALLADCVAEHLAEHGWDTFGDVVVSLERSDALHTGQFRTRSTVDPDVKATSGRGAGQPAGTRSAPPRNAGDRSMSQQPGHAPDGDPYGQYGYGQGQYGNDPNYGYGQQGGYDQGYGQQGGGYGGQQGYGQQQGGYAQPGYDQGSASQLCQVYEWGRRQRQSILKQSRDGRGESQFVL